MPKEIVLQITQALEDNWQPDKSKEPHLQGGAFENPKTISTACHETHHNDISCNT